ncbi:MAG: endonuclease/exonuclease/phosphatase family protein [Mycobacterium sp.]
MTIKGFDAASGRWLAQRLTDADERRDQLTVATYNIWFNEQHAERRYQAIADLLSQDPPDIMAFQEVNDTALSVLLAQRWIRRQYVSAAMTGPGVGNYGMLMLSRVPIRRVTYTKLPTRLSRGYLTAQLTVNGDPLSILSTHLESSKAAVHLRARQLGRMFDSQRDSDNVLIMGDFNMRDSENSRIDTNYRDVWPLLRPDDPGFTEDTSINHMRYDMKDKHRHVRFDRVLVKGAAWVPESIELLGREPISRKLPRIFPSDHFGVQCTLRRAR